MKDLKSYFFFRVSTQCGVCCTVNENTSSDVLSFFLLLKV